MLILVIEHDDEYAEIIAESLRRASHEVVIAGSLNGAMRFVKRGSLDMAILDDRLGDSASLDVAREIREESPDLPIIVVSENGRASNIVAAFEAGADDYIQKPFHPSEFTARVRAVARRYRRLSVAPAVAPTPRISGRGLEFDDENASAYLDGRNLSCTRLEFDILKEMAAVPGQVLSHRFLNERIWSYSNLEDGTLLKGHVSAIRRKLRDAGGHSEMIRTVHGVGYCFAPPTVENGAASHSMLSQVSA